MPLVHFSGRLRRPAFAIAHLATSAIGALAFVTLIALLRDPAPGSLAELGLLAPALLLVGVLALLARTSLEIRRLHDMGWSARWSPLVLAAYVALSAAAYAAIPDGIDDELGATAVEAVAVLPIAFFLVLAFAPPEPGTNRHGDRPASPWALREPHAISH